MGLERLELGVRVRKFVVISVKTCYRSVWNHPFLVGLVCFLIFLYRSCPFLFSLLVTASPVLVCTAVLLGTLLTFGSPNIPEIEEKEEEKVSHEVSPLKTGATEDDYFVERDVGGDDFVIERHIGKRWDVVENADEKVSLVDNEVSKVEEDDGSVCYKLLVDEYLDSTGIHHENGVIDGVKGMLNDLLVEKKRENQGEMLGNEGVLSMGEPAEDQHLLADEVHDSNLEVDGGKFERGVGGDDFVVQRHVGKRWDIVENVDEKVSLVDNEVSEVKEDDGSVRYKLLVGEDLDSMGFHCEDGVIDGVKGMLNDLLVEKKREDQQEVLGSEGILSMGEPAEDQHLLADEVHDRNLEVDNGKFERDVAGDDFVVERHVGKRWDMVENVDEKISLVDNEVSEVEEDDGSVHYKLLVDEDLDSMGIHHENGVIDGVEGMLNDLLVKKREILKEMLGSEGVLSMREPAEDQHLLADEVRDRNLELDDGKFAADFSDVPRGDELDSSLVSSWKRVVADEDGSDAGDDYDDESLDSGSDGAESSSPDTSMTDIIPMLDELHPLLGSEAPRPAQLSHDGSDAASERSHGSSSNDESVESDELENQREEDNDDEEDEVEGAKADKEDESKSAIKWTEDDQKNLVDLGTSELERNLRLEILIARRGARKNMGLTAEKNLIDLDPADIPLNVTPISTTRRNPFELPYDSCDDLGLPPIPGSAPSILQPRKNPFDISFDSSEEAPDLKGDSFQEEFSGFDQRETVSQREAIFRRHESFNVGPSSFGVPKQELKWKPYFVPERLVTEGASLSSFQRQSSDVSESKLSSVPDTESVSSFADEEDMKPNDHDVSQETELILNEDRASVHDEQESQSSMDVESVDVVQAENRDVHHDVVEITLGEGESQLEIESNLSDAGATSHLELNASDIESTTHVDQAENSDVHHDVIDISSRGGEIQLELESNLSAARATTHMQLNASQIHPRRVPVAEDYSSRSNLSSLSETDEEISDVKGEGFASFEPRDHEIKKSGFSTQPSFEESEFQFTSRVVDDDQRREPVYDSSPPSVGKVLSFSSVSSNAQAEISETGLPLTLVESTDEELEGHGETTEQSTASFQGMHAASLDLLNENETRAMDLPEISMHNVTYAGSLGVSSTSADHNVSIVPECVVEYVSADAGSSSLDEGLKEQPIDEHYKLEEPSIIATGSRGDVNIVNNDVNVDEVHDSKDKLSKNFSSTTLESTSPAESPEHMLPADQEEDKILNELVSKGPKEVSEDFNYTAEVHTTRVDDQNISEKEDDCKEVDEGLLSELDNVGDFNIKGIGLPEGYHVAYTESAPLPEDVKTEINAELPVLEARSVEDINLAFKQLHEGVDVEEVILPSMIENQQDHADISSKLPVVEARSLEDIHNAFHKGQESISAELPHPSDLRKESAEVEWHDAVSANEIEVSDIVAGIQENSENAAAGELKNEYKEASEKSSLNLEGKKVKSHDSSSSWSSSDSE